jgi:hypothetical protein
MDTNPLGAIGTPRALRTSSRGQHDGEKFKAAIGD